MNRITKKCLSLFLSDIIDTFNLIAKFKPYHFIDYFIQNDIKLNNFIKNKEKNEVVYLFNSNNKYSFSLLFSKSNNLLSFSLYFIKKDILLEIITIKNIIYHNRFNINNLLNQTKYIKLSDYDIKVNKDNTIELENIFIKIVNQITKILNI
jgi:hypothetical protein